MVRGAASLDAGDCSVSWSAGESRITRTYLTNQDEADRRPRTSDSARLRAGGATARSRRSFSVGGSEPRERSAPAKRRARERVGESEGRTPRLRLITKRHPQHLCKMDRTAPRRLFDLFATAESIRHNQRVWQGCPDRRQQDSLANRL